MAIHHLTDQDYVVTLITEQNKLQCIVKNESLMCCINNPNKFWYLSIKWLLLSDHMEKDRDILCNVGRWHVYQVIATAHSHFPQPLEALWNSNELWMDMYLEPQCPMRPSTACYPWIACTPEKSQTPLLPDPNQSNSNDVETLTAYKISLPHQTNRNQVGAGACVPLWWQWCWRGGWIEPKPQIDAPAELVDVIVHNIGW